MKYLLGALVIVSAMLLTAACCRHSEQRPNCGHRFVLCSPDCPDGTGYKCSDESGWPHCECNPPDVPGDDEGSDG